MRNRLMKNLIFTGPIFAFLLLAALPGPAEEIIPAETPAARPGKKPNLILIFLDSLRADHLGCYGYGRETSPVIDNLSRRGVLVRNVVSPAPATFPSVHSIITSRASNRFFLSPRCSLPGSEITIAEILRARGWKTAAFSSSPLIIGRSESGHYAGGFDQGFETFDDTNPAGKKWGWVSKTPEGIIDKAIPWLESNSRERFFLFLYIMDPHDRYHSPEPFNSLYDPAYHGRKMVSKGDATHYEQRIIRGKESRLKDVDVRHLEALYDGEITYADTQIGRLLDAIRRLGIEKNSLIVITSDHGEEFFDHGGLKHCYTLYRELIDIPLILSWPSGLPSGVVVDNHLIQGIDIVPTILDLMGLSAPDVMEGTSIKPLLFSSDISSRGYALSEAPFIDAKTLITPEWKYIHHFETELLHPHLAPKYAKGRALYDRKHDLREENNLVDKHPEIARKMLDFMLKILPPEERNRLEKRTPLTLDEDSIKQLKSLGYLR